MKTQLCIFLLLISSCLFGQENQSLDSLTRVLEKMYYNDQNPRIQHETLQKDFGFSSEEVIKQNQIVHFTDSVNIILVSQIIDKYGWLSAKETSDTANRALFLVIQHADLETELKYLDVLKNAVRNGKALPSYYALLLDRTNMYLGKLQEFGSQLTCSFDGKCYFFPIRDEPDVNNRRKSIGLPTMEEYSEKFNIVYTLPKCDLYKKCYVFTGYVLDTLNKPIENVTVFMNKKMVVKTDNSGFYNFVIKRKKMVPSTNICFSKQGFVDCTYPFEKVESKDVYEQYIWLSEKKSLP